MPRTISSQGLASLFAQQTGEAWLLLLTLSHPSLPTPIRVVNNHENIESDGETFVAFTFEITLASEHEDRPPTAALRIDNVDRSIVQAVRQLQGEPVTATISVVMASTPGTIEVGPMSFKLRSATYDALVVQGELLLEDVLNDPSPSDRFTPGNFPGLA